MTEEKNNLQERAQFDGQRLGFLIAALPVDQKTKEDLLNSLPALSEADLQNLLSNLETLYLQASTNKLDVKLETDLQKVQATYDKKVGAAKKTALSAMADLEKDLDKMAN